MCGISAVATTTPFFSREISYISRHHRSDSRRHAETLSKFHDDLEHFVRVVRQGKQFLVARTDQSIFLQCGVDPREQTFPEILADQNQREPWNALRLHQGDEFEELVER